MPQSHLYVGLMSGTSMDGIDAVIVDFASIFPTLLATHHHAYPQELRQRLLSLSQPGDNEIEQLGALEGELGHLFAQAAGFVIHKADVSPSAVAAIGSHGQTIRHRPSGRFPFSLQIGDPNIIAEVTGCSTVADFRRRDMAVGGQGAPLVPAFHEAVFRLSNVARVVVNIGGMANISILPRDPGGLVTGFDTGPGNVLMDSWISANKGDAFDRDGAWAKSGKVDEGLLETLLAHPYFHQSPPKSTGREQFNLGWLQLQVRGQKRTEDIQATLCELTAKSIADAIDRHAPDTEEILVCGGGAHNQYLLARLQAICGGRNVESTERHGVAPQWVEAVAFAWLARQTLRLQTGNVPSVTGASHAVILGAIWPGRLHQGE